MKIVNNMLVQHNIPLAFADHLSPIIFKDSVIARDYSSANYI